MTPDLFTVQTSGAMEAAVGAANGVRAADLDALVARGRQVHDDLLLARARGQVGFGDLYMLGREAMRARDVAESLASRFDNVAVLAQGAEADVAAALLGALAHPFHNLLPRAGRAGRPRVFLVDSMDPDWLGAFVEAFAVEQTLLVSLAKRGTELGPLVQFGIVRDLLKKRIGPGFQDHLVVVTDPKGGTLREEALRDGLLAFEIPGNVPARYSALTPIGLFPAAMAGVDVRGVLAGAHAAAERTAGEDLRNNPAYLLAAMLHVLRTERGRSVCLFVACTEALASTAVHLARLFEESIGKGPTEGGVRQPTCAAAALPRDELTLAQRCAQSGTDVAVVLVEAARSTRDPVFPKDAPGLASLGGRNLSDIAAADLAATRRLLREHGVPCLTLRMPVLGANTIGALHMGSMLAAAFAAGLAGVDAFSTPGADLRRRLADEELGRPRAE